MLPRKVQAELSMVLHACNLSPHRVGAEARGSWVQGLSYIVSQSLSQNHKETWEEGGRKRGNKGGRGRLELKESSGVNGTYIMQLWTPFSLGSNCLLTIGEVSG